MPPAPRTHCQRGHELAGDNLWIGRRTDGRDYPYRRCKACKWLTQRERRGHDMKVSNEGLRDAFLRSEMSPVLIARLCGWERNGGPGRGRIPDDPRVRILLGLKDNHSVVKGRRYTYRRTHLRLHEAEQIMRAIGADPHEVGL